MLPPEGSNNRNSTNPKLQLLWGSTMYHLDDLPFSIGSLPDVYTQFRKVHKCYLFKAVFFFFRMHLEVPQIGSCSDILKKRMDIHSVVDSWKREIKFRHFLTFSALNEYYQCLTPSINLGQNFQKVQTIVSYYANPFWKWQRSTKIINLL